MCVCVCTVVQQNWRARTHERLLMDKEALQRIWILRKHLADMNSVEAMEFVKDRVEASRNNEDFLASMNG